MKITDWPVSIYRAVKNAPKKQTRPKPTHVLDNLFLWLAKTGAIRGSLLLLPLLIPVIFLSSGLIYHFSDIGGWISLTSIVTIVVFSYFLTNMTIYNNRYSVRKLGLVYLAVFLTLMVSTAGIELWLFN